MTVMKVSKESIVHTSGAGRAAVTAVYITQTADGRTPGPGPGTGQLLSGRLRLL